MKGQYGQYGQGSSSVNAAHTRALALALALALAHCSAQTIPHNPHSALVTDATGRLTPAGYLPSSMINQNHFPSCILKTPSTRFVSAGGSSGRMRDSSSNSTGNFKSIIVHVMHHTRQEWRSSTSPREREVFGGRRQQQLRMFELISLRDRKPKGQPDRPCPRRVFPRFRIRHSMTPSPHPEL
jgi:hypothetical protein